MGYSLPPEYGPRAFRYRAQMVQTESPSFVREEEAARGSSPPICSHDLSDKGTTQTPGGALSRTGHNRSYIRSTSEEVGNEEEGVGDRIKEEERGRQCEGIGQGNWVCQPVSKRRRLVCPLETPSSCCPASAMAVGGIEVGNDLGETSGGQSMEGRINGCGFDNVICCDEAHQQGVAPTHVSPSDAQWSSLFHFDPFVGMGIPNVLCCDEPSCFESSMDQVPSSSALSRQPRSGSPSQPSTISTGFSPCFDAATAVGVEHTNASASSTCISSRCQSPALGVHIESDQECRECGNEIGGVARDGPEDDCGICLQQCLEEGCLDRSIRSVSVSRDSGIGKGKGKQKETPPLFDFSAGFAGGCRLCVDDSSASPVPSSSANTHRSDHSSLHALCGAQPPHLEYGFGHGVGSSNEHSHGMDLDDKALQDLLYCCCCPGSIQSLPTPPANGSTQLPSSPSLCTSRIHRHAEMPSAGFRSPQHRNDMDYPASFPDVPSDTSSSSRTALGFPNSTLRFSTSNASGSDLPASSDISSLVVQGSAVNHDAFKNPRKRTLEAASCDKASRKSTRRPDPSSSSHCHHHNFDCHWAGCGQVFDSKESLIMHVNEVHLHLAGSNNSSSSSKTSETSSPAEVANDRTAAGGEAPPGNHMTIDFAGPSTASNTMEGSTGGHDLLRCLWDDCYASASTLLPSNYNSSTSDFLSPSTASLIFPSVPNVHPPTAANPASSPNAYWSQGQSQQPPHLQAPPIHQQQLGNQSLNLPTSLDTIVLLQHLLRDHIGLGSSQVPTNDSNDQVAHRQHHHRSCCDKCGHQIGKGGGHHQVTLPPPLDAGESATEAQGGLPSPASSYGAQECRHYPQKSASSRLKSLSISAPTDDLGARGCGKDVTSTSSAPSANSIPTSSPLLSPVTANTTTANSVKTSSSSTPALNDASSSDSMPSPQTTPHVCQWKGCSGVFDSTAALMDHLGNDHVGSGKSHYYCQWEGCGRAAEGRKFVQRQKVMRHLQTHTGDRPFLCTICGKSFSESTTLQQHHRTHTNERPYACTHPGCEKSFALASALTIHLRTHSGDKPFKCPYEGCTAAFAESSNLSKHVRTHNGEKPFKCNQPFCNKCFTRSDQLNRHLKKVHKVGIDEAGDTDDWKSEGKAAAGGGERPVKGRVQDEVAVEWTEECG